MAHPQVTIPADSHGKVRYDSAKRHAAAAKKAGKSSEEIHAIFKKVMSFNPATDLEKIPKDEAHKKYRAALLHAIKAKEAGKTPDEIHTVFEKIRNGVGSGHCKTRT